MYLDRLCIAVADPRMQRARPFPFRKREGQPPALFLLYRNDVTQKNGAPKGCVGALKFDHGNVRSEYQAATTSATSIGRGQEKAALTSHIGSYSTRNAPRLQSITDLAEAEVGEFAGVFKHSHEIPGVEAGKLLCFRLAES
jgi:hypothetical protein